MNKQYEIVDHLGNVHVVVSDRKLVVDANSNNIFDAGDYFTADVLSATDYGPFGDILPGRSFNSSEYSYGFNGKLKDDEIKGSGNSYDYGFRIYDPRLGRFLSVDPLSKTYPWYTPYQFAGNKPIWAIDVDGLEEYIYQYSINDNLNVTLIKKERNVEMREKVNASGIHSGISDAYNKRTGEKLTDYERGKVQYEYFYKGTPVDIHRKMNGDFAKGAGEMMSKHEENYDKSIYISSPFGKDPMVGGKDDYRREPTDVVDAAALTHDKNYDKARARGTWDALTNKKTLMADIQLLGEVQNVIDNYGNKDYTDPYTNKPISEQTYSRALVIKAAFVPIVANKIQGNSSSSGEETK